MKRSVVIGGVIAGVLFILSAREPSPKPVYIPASQQRSGDPSLGYAYVVEGDYLRSGIPYEFFIKALGKDKHHYITRDGLNANIPYNFTAVKAPNGVMVVVPNCLQCHAQVFGDKLIIGLGNTDQDFTHNLHAEPQILRGFIKAYYGKNSDHYEAAARFIQVTGTVYPSLVTRVRGVNTADRLAALLAAHRDPRTLHWSDTPSLSIPAEVIPTDVPAWWLLKKKHAMFYNGFGRGDFGKFLMASNLLTVEDTAEANVVDSHIPNVLSWLLTLEPPKYPYPVDAGLAARGKEIFTALCAHCHGTYGPEGAYPNLLIPEEIVRTDSFLYKSNFQYPQFIDWFNNSWFSSGPYPAQLSPFNGYIAPPLDGIWVTAPYFHNGSVPTLEAVLDSKNRPTYWSRFLGSKTVYDYQDIGFKVDTFAAPGGSTVYNTTLPGYGNYGHTFGDKLSDKERKEVLEYLKTL
ncbi:c-type cytochrome [Dinghuibacter silviterrae]|uniref:Cytochrome c n=1 Tax=Dinghuibacter silviterrae TaxID=1539049 RepID=A0A4R8DTV8_9BACT|nr:c-type cytochrome [Dinghuibacter silviterrae]TDX00561.1 cytochrome c [Dinghuibacter silviterrae]